MKPATCHSYVEAYCKGLCRPCYNRDYRARNSERIAQQRADHYSANRDVLVKQQREYNNANRESINIKRREYVARNPEAVKASKAPSERSRRLQRYGLTAEAYDALLESQGGGCAACGLTPEQHGKALCVDHDHKCCPGEYTCGQCVRGLLCTKCNIALGYLNDDPERVMKLAAYVLHTNQLGGTHNG